MNEKIREWDKPFVAWDSDLQLKFIAWIIDTYGEKGAHEYLEEFRAVKDVEASVKTDEEIMGERYTDHLAHAMLHTKQAMAANLLNKVWNDE